jgi:AraC-like DNA-binding protein
LTAYLDALFAVEYMAEPALAGVHVADLAISPETSPARAATGSQFSIPSPGRPPIRSSTRPAWPSRSACRSRYLHRVLQGTGRTFSQHVLHQRLRDPRLAQSKIGELALSAGSIDLSHFNRSYRRHFNETPSTTGERSVQGEPVSAEPHTRPYYCVRRAVATACRNSLLKAPEMSWSVLTWKNNPGEAHCSMLP